MDSLHKQAADVTLEKPWLILSSPVENDVDVNAKGPSGMTDLHLALCRAGYGDELEVDKDGGVRMVSNLMILGGDCKSQTDGGETPLHLVARQGKAKIAKLSARSRG